MSEIILKIDYREHKLINNVSRYLDKKMENELSKYEYGFEIVITKTGYAIEFGIYDNTTKKMILFINNFSYFFKKNKWVRDFNLDFNM